MNAANQNAARNRSDQMRQRRTTQSNARIDTAARRAVTEAPLPVRPVTVRNTTFGTPVRQRVATTNPRRQYYVALDTPGTELRLPALPSLRPGARAVSGILAIAALIGIFSILFSSFFTLGAPKVTGLNRLTQMEIEAAIDTQNLSVVQLDAAAVRASLLEKYPILKDASVSVALPNKLSIKVVERKPVLSWTIKDAERWADSEGVLFNPAGKPAELLKIKADSQPPMVLTPEDMKTLQQVEQQAAAAGSSPVVTTLKNQARTSGPDKIDPVFLSAAQKLATHLPAGTELAYSALHGLGWQDAGGWDVYIGSDLSSFDQKYALYQSLSKQLADQGITPAIISVEFMDAPYYRMEK